MQQPIPRTLLILTSLGTLPFIAQFLLFAVQLTDADFVLQLAEWNFYAVHVVLIYGAGVLIFMNGVNWGLAIQHKMNQGAMIYVGSSCVFLGILTLMVLNFYAKFIFAGLAIFYGANWFGNYILYRYQYAPPWYFRLYCLMTPLVVISLLGIQVVVYCVKI